MSRSRIEFLFLNLGHFYDHFCMLVFATVAALVLATEWNMTYAQLIPYATPGFIAFGAGALVSGWLADRWSRTGMMAIFFFGIGAATIVTGFARTPLEIGAGLFLIGCFASIYHPVGIAMVVQNRPKTGMALAVNGIFGNLGVAVAAFASGYLIEYAGWRAAFLIPGAVTMATGMLYVGFLFSGRRGAGEAAAKAAAAAAAGDPPPQARAILIRMFAIIFFSTTMGSLIFQCTTFSLPKIFEERLTSVAVNPTEIGSWAFVVFAVAAFAQVVVGHLIDRHSIRTVFMVVAGLQVPLFAVMVDLAGVPALAASFAFMLLVFGQIPINDALVARITKSAWRSRVYSLKYILSFTISATAVPLIAVLHEVWGFSAMFLVMAVAAALIFVSVQLLPRTGAVLVDAPAPAE